MKYLCYLPFRGEFGWYLFTYVKRIQAETDPFKLTIVCCKHGHEALFPTATHFYYQWSDIPDHHKAGIAQNQDEDLLKKQILEHYQLSADNVEFKSPNEMGWDDRERLAKYTFIPKPISKLDSSLICDVAITPRYRKIDVLRNIPERYWQEVVNQLVEAGLKIGACGSKDSSYQLKNIHCRAWDHIDIDTDLNLMLNAKIVLTQESGLAYLAYMCKRPIAFIGHYMGDLGADLHRDFTRPFFHVSPNVENLDDCIRDTVSIIKKFCSERIIHIRYKDEK